MFASLAMPKKRRALSKDAVVLTATAFGPVYPARAAVVKKKGAFVCAHCGKTFSSLVQFVAVCAPDLSNYIDEIKTKVGYSARSWFKDFVVVVLQH